MKAVFYFVLSLAFLMLLNAPKVAACSCLLVINDDKQQIKKAYEQSSNVFAGEVIAVNQNLKDFISVKLKVLEVWKGKAETDLVVKVSRNKSGCAYFPFEPGKKYLVYAEEYKNELYLPDCLKPFYWDANGNKKRAWLDKLRKRQAKSSPK